MENKDWSMELMAYLYDEMTEKEKLQFEKALAANPILRDELESLKRVRNELANIKDKEVVEPLTLSDIDKSFPWTKGTIRQGSGILRSVLAIAASLILLMMAGYLTRFQLNYQKGTLTAGFNHTSPVIENTGLTKDEITDLIHKEIASNNKFFADQLNVIDSAMKVRLTSIASGIESSRNKSHQASSALNIDDIEDYFKLAQNNQNQMLRDYLQSSSEQQQEYLKTMLVQFSDFMQEQRREDLLMIQSNFVNLKENQDQQKQETDQLLARILTTVNTQND